MADPPVAASRAPAPPRELPEGYYLDNFELLLATVEGVYADLLSSEERDFLAAFRGLSLPARRLYVRLVSRKGPCFRLDRVRYAEIPDLLATVAELTASGFLGGSQEAELADLLALLLRDELAALVAELLPAVATSGLRRPELLAELGAGVEEEALRRAVEMRLQVIQPRRQEQILVFRLLFFGNLYQDWTEFVLRDLGVVRYERYPLRRELRLFPDRRAVDDHFELRCRRQEVSVLLDAGDSAGLELAAAVLARAEEWHPSARPVLDRILLRVARHLERAGEAEAALVYYRAAQAPPARERQARILHGLERNAEALELVAEILADPRDETEVAFGPLFHHRLSRPRGERTARKRTARPQRELLLPAGEGAVEQQTLAALAAAGQPGCFAENWLWKSLFGLAFWDIVFAPVRGVFHHPFQLGPTDLHSTDFRRQRAALIEQRLGELRAETDLRARLHTTYEAKRDIANALVTWHPDLWAALDLVLHRLQGRHLALVSDRLSQDPGRYRRGLPDLFVFTNTDPGFELCEVKAPGDQLRPEQASWIDYLNGAGIPAVVLKVRW